MTALTSSLWYLADPRSDQKLVAFGVSSYIKKKPRKRPGRHAKSYSKRIPKRKKSRGQGKKRVL